MAKQLISMERYASKFPNLSIIRLRSWPWSLGEDFQGDSGSIVIALKGGLDWNKHSGYRHNSKVYMMTAMEPIQNSTIRPKGKYKSLSL